MNPFFLFFISVFLASMEGVLGGFKFRVSGLACVCKRIWV